MNRPKIAAAVLSLTVLVAGVVVGVFLLRANQSYLNKAAVPEGAGRIWLEPSGGEIAKGERKKVDIYFTTGEGDSAHYISAISLRIVLDNNTILKLEGESGNSSRLIINPDLLLSGYWTAPVNELKQDGQKTIIDLGAVNTSTTGYKAGSPQKLASFYVEALEEGTATFTFDNVESHMFSKAGSSEDILQNPNVTSFSVIEDNLPPKAVTDFRVMDFSLDGVSFQWTSPEDQDSSSGSQAGKIVYNTEPITEQNWASSTELVIHNSSSPGVIENALFRYSGEYFSPKTVYYFALKTYDAWYNYSDISNVVRAIPTEPDSILDFGFRLQGINEDLGLIISATTYFRSPSGDVTSFLLNVHQSADIFYPQNEFKVNDVYDMSRVPRFSVKVPNYLMKSWNAISLNYGKNILREIPTLMVGDFDNDNKIDILDIGLLLSVYNSLSVPVNETNQKYDVDGNGVINIFDISIVLSNYTELVVRGDEI